MKLCGLFAAIFVVLNAVLTYAISPSPEINYVVTQVVSCVLVLILFLFQVKGIASDVLNQLDCYASICSIENEGSRVIFHIEQ